MAKILNIGSINIDYVYKVSHFLRAGETLMSADRAIHMGGKGLNQSVAMRRCGLDVAHAGVIGSDGEFIYQFLCATGVKTDDLRVDRAQTTGHTVIQVTPDAENAILYFPGTNHQMTDAHAQRALDRLEEGDFVVFQNEVNDIPRWMHRAKKRNLRIIFNPSPFSSAIHEYPLDLVDVLICNETEACELLHIEPGALTPSALYQSLSVKFADKSFILTVGVDGIYWSLGASKGHLPAFKVQAVDTTGAGDTFAGYAMAALVDWFTHEDEVRLKALFTRAVMAAALSVTKEGAVVSIPTAEEVTQACVARGVSSLA